ncbi:MAG: homogentisate 1,2-dioxygenase [Magnetococcales bacterium]|nr:homogentisate 1,2-dioxygenase [Magnetococcales bacterium]|tara:strand:- start:824 stop:1954 length:1131 start_codon:yes stop_codon:yes gene_type:complete
MKKWINFIKGSGTFSRQAHVGLPENTFEREAGREGFFGPATHLHHKHPPTAWKSFTGNLKPRSFDLNKWNQNTHRCPWHADDILKNNNCHMRMWFTKGGMKHLVRNADGDDLLFIHEGSGKLFCDYGHMPFSEGDYVLIPRGTMWRIEVESKSSILLIQNTNGAYKLPEKGMLGPHAVFDEAMLDTPEIDETFLTQQDENDWEVRIKKNGEITKVVFPHNPLDAIGWHGNNVVVKINWRDIRPVISHRYHLPPSAHTTFIGEGFVVCTFVPRPYESSPRAIKVPFFHSNDDYDEVLFYHQGNFFSRDNIDAGMLTYHPSGFPHGPHPKALKNMLVQEKEATDEVAVMIDTRHPLTVCDDAKQIENDGYVNSWRVSE